MARFMLSPHDKEFMYDELYKKNLKDKLARDITDYMIQHHHIIFTEENDRITAKTAIYKDMEEY